MRPLSGIEKGILLLAALFFIVGVDTVIYPTEGIVIHQVYRRSGYYIEHVSKTGARLYGVLGILISAGFTWTVFYGRRK